MQFKSDDGRVLPLGPAQATNIAIIGSAPSSLRLAPYDHPQWAIWGCSPGVYGYAKRLDAFFEMHRWEPQIPGKPDDAAAKPWFSPEYVAFMQNFPGPVFLSTPPDEPFPVKNGVRYPFADMIALHGPYFFTSSVAWMLALALDILLPLRAKGVECKIGLWGVDMAANTEYAFQRPGCQHFMGIAAAAGIKIVLPPESDLMQPPTLYGVSEYHPRHVRILARINEMKAKQAQLVASLQAQQAELNMVNGALDSLNYVFEQWVNDLDPGFTMANAVSRAPILLGRSVAETAAMLLANDKAQESTGAQVVELKGAS